MFTRFDTNKSTKGASKLRRDLINAEIANLRDLLPLPQSTRQRLSQLQLMALVCVYVRKANYFQQVFKRYDNGLQNSTPNIGFSKALCGFLMMITQNGKLLYISDNAAEYLGHSMEDLLIHGDSVYDIIDKQDYNAIQAELGRSGAHHHPTNPLHSLHHHIVNLDGEQRIFLCRMNVSRNARRQMRFGDQKVVLIQGHYLSFLPLCSRNEPVFLATCTPIAMPETRECVVQGATNVFTTIHTMDMKIVHIDKNGEFHLDYTKDEISGSSWYHLIHWDYIKEAQIKHRLITQSEQDRSCILLLRMQKKTGDFIWVHVVLQVRDSQDSNQQSVIVCTNQVLSDKEANVMLSNSWLYHYYSVQSKIQLGLSFETTARLPQINNNNNNTYYPYQQPGTTIPQSYPLHQTYDMHATNNNNHHLNNQHCDYSSSPTQNHQNDINDNKPIGGKESAPVDYSSSPQHHDKSSPVHENGNHGVDKSGDYKEQRKKADQSGVDNKGNKTHDKKLTKDDYKSVRISNKKYTFKRIESLHISNDHLEATEIAAPQLIHTMDGDMQTAYLNTANTVPSRSRISKTFSSSLPTLPHPIESSSAEIEQWNPSPTWSDTNIQKVPDIMHQQLSPYLITTPPTPISASHITTHHGPSSFNFDWVPEYVPTIIHHEESPPRCLHNRPPQIMTLQTDDSNNSNNGHKDDETKENNHH